VRNNKNLALIFAVQKLRSLVMATQSTHSAWWY